MKSLVFRRVVITFSVERHKAEHARDAHAQANFASFGGNSRPARRPDPALSDADATNTFDKKFTKIVLP
jgi:hypothetical protein